MYAIIRDQNQQTKVHEGDLVQLDLKSNVQPGDTLTFEEVLLVGNEGDVKVGQPTVPGAKVTAEVVGEEKGKKIIALRFKRRKNVRVKRGHRQRYTLVRITGIEA